MIFSALLIFLYINEHSAARPPTWRSSFVAVGGLVLAAISAEQQAGSDKSPQAAQFKQMGLRVGDVPERTATMVMTILGLPQKEAEAIANLPL